MMNAIVAAASALVLGLLSLRPRDYVYWRSWASGALLTCLGVLVTFHTVAGLAAYGLFQALGAGGDTTAVVAAGQGVAGQAAVRAELSGSRLDGGRDRRSVLALVESWLVEWMDDAARRRVRATLLGLDGHELVGLTFAIFWEHTDVSGRDDPVVAQQHTELRQAAAATAAHGTEGIDAHARLQGFCLRQIARKRLTLERRDG
jgi:hypothetical protein